MKSHNYGNPIVKARHAGFTSGKLLVLTRRLGIFTQRSF